MNHGWNTDDRNTFLNPCSIRVPSVAIKLLPLPLRPKFPVRYLRHFHTSFRQRFSTAGSDEDLAFETDLQAPVALLRQLGLEQFAGMGAKLQPHVRPGGMDARDHRGEGRMAVAVRLDVEVVRTDEDADAFRRAEPSTE